MNNHTYNLVKHPNGKRDLGDQTSRKWSKPRYNAKLVVKRLQPTKGIGLSEDVFINC